MKLVSPLVRLTLVFALAVSAGSLTSAPRAEQAAPPKAAASFLVTPAWLAEHQGTERLVLLHIGEKGEYEKGHIPGAQSITLPEISDTSAKLHLQMASVDQLKGTFERLGVTDSSHIVLYWGKDWVTPTARVFVALDYLGLANRTSVLDGGLPAWQAEGRSVTDVVAPVTPGHVTPHPRPEAIVDVDWVQSRLHNPAIAIVDARSADFYTGAQIGNGKAGHIAGAFSIPFMTVIDPNSLKMKDKAALRTLFEAAGVKPGAEVVTYCHIGQQASQVYFAAKLLGYQVHLYDGSFEDWAAHPDLPVESVKDKKQ